MAQRRLFIALVPVPLLVLLAMAAGCGGPGTRLVTVRSGTGSGPVQLEVENQTGAPINNFFLAPSDAVPPSLDPDSPEGQAAWGGDLLSAAIPRGERRRVPVSRPGEWDARALDRDGRYQHISALRLRAGGRYILELHDSGWRVR
jgi:hypothetical protein